MRRVGISLLFAALAVALIGAAPVHIPPPVKPLASGLRGAQSAKPAAKPAPALLATAGLPPLDASGIPADPGQCRSDCGHAYYFCLAGEDAPSCPATWTSCLASCSRPALQP